MGGKMEEKWEEKQGDATVRNCKKLQALRIEIYVRNCSYDVIGKAVIFPTLKELPVSVYLDRD